MAEYIERAAANEAMRECVRVYPSSFYNGIEAARSVIIKLPAADVRPVVLCKDCRHRDPEDHKCDSGETERQGCPFKVADDYFCAYGER